MSNTAFISQIYEFINELIKSLDSGTLFFGSFWDFIRYAADILLGNVLRRHRPRHGRLHLQQDALCRRDPFRRFVPA